MARSAAARKTDARIKAEVTADANRIQAPLTRRQKRLAAALAHPDVATQTQAALIAGYAPDRNGYIAGSAASVARSGQVRALAVQVAESRRDKATRAFDAAGSKVVTDIAQVGDPMYTLAAWKTSAEIMERIPEESKPGIDYHVRQQVLRKTYRAMLAGARHPELAGWLEERIKDVEQVLDLVDKR